MENKIYTIFLIFAIVIGMIYLVYSILVWTDKENEKIKEEDKARYFKCLELSHNQEWCYDEFIIK
jgi:hypothetical protein